MIKELSKCIREYKAASIKAPIYVSLEVVMECIIPFIIAQLVNEIKAGCSFSVIATYGSILLVMAAVSLVFGGDGWAVAHLRRTGGQRLRHRKLRLRAQSAQGHVL